MNSNISELYQLHFVNWKILLWIQNIIVKLKHFCELETFLCIQKNWTLRIVNIVNWELWTVNSVFLHCVNCEHQLCRSRRHFCEYWPVCIIRNKTNICQIFFFVSFDSDHQSLFIMNPRQQIQAENFVNGTFFLFFFISAFFFVLYPALIVFIWLILGFSFSLIFFPLSLASFLLLVF